MKSIILMILSFLCNFIAFLQGFFLFFFCLRFSFFSSLSVSFFIKDNSVHIFVGNHFVHTLTSSGKYELRIDLIISNTKKYAVYKRFSIGDAALKYKLNVGDFSGNAGKIVNTSIFLYNWISSLCAIGFCAKAASSSHQWVCCCK